MRLGALRLGLFYFTSDQMASSIVTQGRSEIDGSILNANQAADTNQI
jgi:hypothetical protein